MGTLRDEVMAQPVGKTGRKPIFDKIQKAFTPAEIKEFIELMDDSTITGRAICTVLNKRGITISEATLYRYRTTGAHRVLA